MAGCALPPPASVLAEHDVHREGRKIIARVLHREGSPPYVFAYAGPALGATSGLGDPVIWAADRRAAAAAVAAEYCRGHLQITGSVPVEPPISEAFHFRCVDAVATQGRGVRARVLG
jgi:hypothetical protein